MGEWGSRMLSPEDGADRCWAGCTQSSEQSARFISSLDHCSRLLLLSPSSLPSPSNPCCLPQPEQCFQTVNQTMSLSTPLLPQLHITGREAKPCPYRGSGLPGRGLGRADPLQFCKLFSPTPLPLRIQPYWSVGSFLATS